MGTWGLGIEADDLVADVIGSFDDRLKRGGSLAEASGTVRRDFAEVLSDPDEGPLLWLALAQAQWRYGAVESEVLQHVREDVLSGRGLSRWREASASDLQRREAVLRRFLAKIESTNPRPKQLPKLIVRRAKFQLGDCLSISLENGQYGAALVLATDETDPEYGKNLICALDYLSPSPPELQVFLGRQWLRLSEQPWDGGPDLAWYLPVRFRADSGRFHVVGKTAILPSDPQTCGTYAGWHHLVERQWSSKQRAT